MSRRSQTSMVVHPLASDEAPTSTLSQAEQHTLAVFDKLVDDIRVLLLDRGDSSPETVGARASSSRSRRRPRSSDAAGVNAVARVLLFARRRLASMVTGVEQEGTEVPISMLTAALEFFCPESGDWLAYQQKLVSSLLEPEGRERFSHRLVEDLAYHVRLAELGQQQGTLRRDVEPSVLGAFMHRFSVGWAMTVWIRGVPPTPGDIAAQFAGFMRMLHPPAYEAPRMLDGATGS